MGMPMCFESDVLRYHSDNEDGTSTNEQFYTLQSGPVVRGDGARLPQAAVWTTRNENAVVPFTGASALNVFAFMSRAREGGTYGWAHWVIDPLDGVVAFRRTYVNGGGIVTLAGIFAEPAVGMAAADPGRLWRFSDGGTSASYQAQRLGVNDGSGEININNRMSDLGAPHPFWHYRVSGSWSQPAPNQAVAIAAIDLGFANPIGDFAIDPLNGRIWMRDTRTRTYGQVSVFTYPGYAFLHYVYSPNPTHQIIPTGDGYVWVIDTSQWCVLYDYDGNYHGAMRNELALPGIRSPTGGLCYGWDHAYKRLLRLDISADAGDQSTVKVRGFTPAADPAYLTKAIPRTVPRKGKKSYFFAHLCDEGGIPIPSRVGRLSVSTPLGLTSDAKISDRDGDFIMPTTPTATGAAAVDLDVPAISTRVSRVSEGDLLPQSVIYVWSTAGFDSSGTFTVQTSAGTETITYTSIAGDAPAFLGCTGGTGYIAQGAQVIQW